MIALSFALFVAQMPPKSSTQTRTDAGICLEYLWSRANDCAVKDDESTWLGDTSIEVSRMPSKVRVTVKCGGKVLVCGEPAVCVCRDAGS